MQTLRGGCVAILGVPVDNVSMTDVLTAIRASIEEGGFHQIATANVDFLMNSIHDPELKDILAACFLVLPDGMPLVWASRLMGSGLQERVSGSDLVPEVASLAASRGYSLFLLGSTEESSHGTADWMESHYPGVKIAGRCCPEKMELDQINHEAILLQIEAARPDILLVAFGSPKQEKWLAMHRHRLQVPVCIGVGGSFDLFSGTLRRAPPWMQHHGLEWFYRTCQEPVRLSMRYVRGASGLMRYMTLQLAATAAQHQRVGPSSIREEVMGTATILRLTGSFTGTPVAGFEADAISAVREGQHLVLDLTATTFLGADALGALIHLASAAHRYQRELWLTGLQPFLQRLLGATQLKSNFRTAPRIADALRRIPPTVPQISIEYGPEVALCRVGGRLIPLGREEAAGVCRQVLGMIEREGQFDPIVNGAVGRKRQLYSQGPAVLQAEL